MPIIFVSTPSEYTSVCLGDNCASLPHLSEIELVIMLLQILRIFMEFLLTCLGLGLHSAA